MINQNNNLDDIDKMLFSYFDNNKDIPSSTQDTILKAFEKPKKTISLVYKIQKVAIILITFIILTTGVVFAKDIINFITSLFTNTTEGINKAIENGYVQNIDMDFVYDNDIGIKVDYLVMDDTNLDVSFVYDYKNNETIKTIGIYEYIIRDEKNNLIYYYFDDISKMNYKKSFSTHKLRNEEQIYCRESILYTSNQFPQSKTLIFEITTIMINNTKITGNWIFNINLEPNFTQISDNIFTTTYNPYIDDITINLQETALQIDLKLNTNINTDLLVIPDNRIIKDKSNNIIHCLYISSKNISQNHSEISLNFDISKYDNNINWLNLFIKLDDTKTIDIILSKQTESIV